jgi:hypothetical protein
MLLEMPAAQATVELRVLHYKCLSPAETSNVCLQSKDTTFYCLTVRNYGLCNLHQLGLGLGDDMLLK